MEFLISLLSPNFMLGEESLNAVFACKAITAIINIDMEDFMTNVGNFTAMIQMTMRLRR